VKVIKPKTVLSDHGSQFTSPQWRKTLTELGIEVRYSPIRHPESNLAERIMRELGKYFRIYCNETRKKWPEFVGHIEQWLNSSVQPPGMHPLNYSVGKQSLISSRRF
jgi:hypothetical protein